MKRLLALRFLCFSLLLGGLLMVGRSDAGAVQAGAAAAVNLLPPTTPPVAGESFRTELVIQAAQDLHGFQVDLVFDPDLLAVQAVDLGPFLGSAGRQALPLGPDLRQAAAGRVTVGGYTLDGPQQPAASGDGLLATITWRALRPGESRVHLEALRLAGADGKSLASTTSAGIRVAAARGRLPRALWIVAAAAATALAIGLWWRGRRT